MTDAQLLEALRGSLADGGSIVHAREIIASALNAVRDDTSAVDTRKRALQREIRNLTDAIAQLGLSDALRERLVAAEAELKALQRRSSADDLPSVDAVLEVYRSMLLRITEALAQDVERARAALAQVLGNVTVRATGEGVFAEMETRPEAVLLAAGGALSLGSVAGVRYVKWNPFRINSVRFGLPIFLAHGQRSRKPRPVVDLIELDPDDASNPDCRNQ